MFSMNVKGTFCFYHFDLYGKVTFWMFSEVCEMIRNIKNKFEHPTKHFQLKHSMNDV